MNFPDFSLTFPVFFAFFQYFLINFSSIFPLCSSVLFIGFSKCSQTCLTHAFLIHFCLIRWGSLKTLEVLSLMPMLSYPLNSSPRSVYRKIFSYFSNELSGSNCICFFCSSNFHQFSSTCFTVFSQVLFSKNGLVTVLQTNVNLPSHSRSLQYPTVNHPL